MSALTQALISRSAAPRRPQPLPYWVTVGANLDARFGGVSSVMAPLSRSIRRHGSVELALAAFAGTDEDLDPVSSAFSRTERYELAGLRGTANPAVTERLAAQIQASAGVHIHGIWQNHCNLAAQIARRARKPYLISAHGMLDPWALKNKRWKKACYLRLVENRNLRRAACLHALTRSEALDYRRIAPRVPVAVIPNGVTVPEQGRPDLFLSRFPELRGRKLVLFLGRIHYKKGLDLLCRAWKGVQEQAGDAELVLAGPDFENTRAAIEKLTEDLGIRGSVTFTGMLAGAEKWSALAAADLFVLPSYSEGLSVSVLEAMGMQKPVLITEQCHVDGVAEHGCGWQIQPRAEELEEALGEFFASPRSRLEEMGAHGAALVATKYCWSNIGEQMLSVYQWLGGGPAPSGVEVLGR